MSSVKKIVNDYYYEKKKFKEAYVQALYRSKIVCGHPDIPDAVKSHFKKLTKSFNQLLKVMIRSDDHCVTDSDIFNAAISINATMYQCVCKYISTNMTRRKGEDKDAFRARKEHDVNFQRCCQQIQVLLEGKNGFTKFLEEHMALGWIFIMSVEMIGLILALIFNPIPYFRPLYFSCIFLLVLTPLFTRIQKQFLIEKSLRAINRNTYASQLRKKRQQEKRSEVIQKIYAIIPTLLKK